MTTASTNSTRAGDADTGPSGPDVLQAPSFDKPQVAAESGGDETHNLAAGYLLWIFGFTGAHRFYYGRPISGTFWLFTLGLLGIGWLVDLFLIPSMQRAAKLRFRTGPVDYTIARALLTFLGLFGIHRFYLQKWPSALLYLLTGGLLGIGVLYDFWTLNDQITVINAQENN